MEPLESVLEIFFSDPFKISCTTNVLFYTWFYIIVTCTAKDFQSLICKVQHIHWNTSFYYHIILYNYTDQDNYPKFSLKLCCYPYHRKVEGKEHSSPSFIINRPFCSVCPSLTKQAGAFCSISSSLISSILQINSTSSILMHINVSFWKNYLK